MSEHVTTGTCPFCSADSHEHKVMTCIGNLREQLTLANQRAEAAGAELQSVRRTQDHTIDALEAERDALRKDAAVIRQLAKTAADERDALLVLNEDLARDNESLDTGLRIAEAKARRLRKVDDAMVERAFRAGNFADRVDDLRAALDAALAVQPSTGAA